MNRYTVAVHFVQERLNRTVTQCFIWFRLRAIMRTTVNSYEAVRSDLFYAELLDEDALGLPEGDIDFNDHSQGEKGGDWHSFETS